GIISCVEIDESDAVSPLRDLETRPVIDRPYHMSYPFLFRYNDALFMLPETSANKTIEVWRCVDFPYTWRREKVLIEGLSAADNTLLQNEGRWWLFTNLDRSGMHDHRNELHIFYADDLLGSHWTPHPGNPVLVDSRRARMAGGFLRDVDGALLRCSQVQGRSYGEALALNRIETLNETTYAECLVGELTAFVSNDFAKHHHIAYADGVLVADGCTYTSRLARKLGLAGGGCRRRPGLVALGRAAKLGG
ncbi:MAG: glucosamine inositolphosphorylceramide transferase family protein, partial [Alphaproteobacteria bacterium]